MGSLGPSKREKKKRSMVDPIMGRNHPDQHSVDSWIMRAADGHLSKTREKEEITQQS